jgi:hypothetical protein
MTRENFHDRSACDQLLDRAFQRASSERRILTLVGNRSDHLEHQLTSW